MLRLILEVPNSRSTKVMGTSAMGKPSLRALYFISIWKAYPMKWMWSSRMVRNVSAR